jgi:shikimate kinase
MKYILVGIPNAGKSTLGKRAAEILKLPFYDTDKLATKKIDPKRFHFFSLSYADRFIEVQKEVLFEIVSKDESSIIATGAILPIDAGLDYILPKIGTVIHIKRNIELARADAISKNSLTMVPIGENGERLYKEAINMSEKAVEKYAKDLPILEEISHFAVENNDDIESGVEKLVKLLTQTMKYGLPCSKVI